MPSLHETTRATFAVGGHAVNHGESVTLSKQGVASDAFNAQYSTEEYESVEFRTGLPLKRRMRDWYMLKSDCVIGGETVEPTAGMIITADSLQWEIAPPNEGRPAVESYAGYQWLCHSQEVTQ